jgi:hypothetical protein
MRTSPAWLRRVARLASGEAAVKVTALAAAAAAPAPTPEAPFQAAGTEPARTALPRTGVEWLVGVGIAGWLLILAGALVKREVAGRMGR